jgi:hypothetical protein
VWKVRGIIALYQNKAEEAFSCLSRAADLLGSPLAVKALRYRASLEKGDGDWDKWMAELWQDEPQTAEDFLFKGMILPDVDDPRKGLDLIKKAMALRQPPSPLARLALAEAQVTLAFDTGSRQDAEDAVKYADRARDDLHDSTHALAACIQARLILWDLYTDSKEPGDKELAAKSLKEIRKLVTEDARGRYSNKLRFGCQYYHSRQRTGEQYARELWERTHEPDAGEAYACELLRADKKGDKKEEVLKLLEETFERRKSRSFVEWYLCACLQKDEDERRKFIREGQKQPRNPVFISVFPAVALLSGSPEKETQEFFNEAVKDERLGQWHHGWYKELARYGAGKITEEKLLRERAGDSRLHRCEGHFYVALHHLARGDKRRAKCHFKEAVKTRVFFYIEHELAGVFLDRMKDDPDWPAWIKPKP